MKELTSVNKFNLFAIPELCKMNFFIPDYQRGYRWGETQIRQLLEDLYTFFYDSNAKGNFYCLQPVVVKKMTDKDVASFDLQSNKDNNTWYEVIDGQQRLTTIRIILAISTLLNPIHKFQFELHYQTRPLLGKIFSNMDIEMIDDEYSVMLKSSTGKLDIDSWHILQTAKRIIKWFQTSNSKFTPTLDEFIGSFYEKFTADKSKNKSVQVIWYEICDGSDQHDIFRRLNDKIVSLNNAELIRGMFLSDSAKYECDTAMLMGFDEKDRKIVTQREQARKQSHIIEQWDIIEKSLRDEKFWSFITNKDGKSYSCRIEYIFDLISKKKESEADPIYTYLHFDMLLRDGKVRDLWELWLKVETYYSMLKSWSEDRFYYHKIGYLVTEQNSEVLTDLLEEAAQYSKSELKADIHNRIKDTITDSNKPDKKITELNYSEDYNILKKVLFLYNVESVYQLGLNSENADGITANTGVHEFFNFSKYKEEKNWTLEHIHAQNSEAIDRNDKKKWDQWLVENLSTLRTLSKGINSPELGSLIEDLDAQLDTLKKNRERYTYNDITNAFDRVLHFFDDMNKSDGHPSEIHGISNMALLSGSLNSSISNSVFEVKRQKIMTADANGEYIPPCTRKVFLKYYNKNEQGFTTQQNFYWSEKDRKNYEKDILKIMKSYL